MDRLCREQLPRPKELISPLTGITDRRVLTREGIRYKGLRWNSKAFSRPRNNVGLDAKVDIWFGLLDPTHAYGLDAKGRKWIQGDLMTEDVEVGETPHHYAVVKKRGRDTREPGESRKVSIAQTGGEIFAFVRAIVEGNKSSKAPKPFARFRESGRKPMERLAPERTLLAESGGGRPGPRFDPERPPRTRHTAAGPYRRAVPSPNWDVEPPPVEPVAD